MLTTMRTSSHRVEFSNGKIKIKWYHQKKDTSFKIKLVSLNYLEVYLSMTTIIEKDAGLKKAWKSLSKFKLVHRP